MPTFDALKGLTTGKGLAAQFGYGDEYADYFTPLNQDLYKTTTKEWGDQYRAPLEQSAKSYYKTNLSSSQDTGRQGLLQNILKKYSQQSGSGFAGSGALDREQSLGDMATRKSYQSDYTNLSNAYGKQMYSIGQDVLDRQGTAQGLVDNWYQTQLESSRRLKEMNAKKESGDVPIHTTPSSGTPFSAGIDPTNFWGIDLSGTLGNLDFSGIGQWNPTTQRFEQP